MAAGGKGKEGGGVSAVQTIVNFNENVIFTVKQLLLHFHHKSQRTLSYAPKSKMILFIKSAIVRMKIKIHKAADGRMVASCVIMFSSFTPFFRNLGSALFDSELL